MGRLIDADDVLKVLCRELCHPGAICPDGYCVEMREKLKDVPTADAVSIVRCKDCRFADAYYHCVYTNFWESAEDYCSRGEKKYG